MKKNFFRSLSMLAGLATVMLTACQKENMETPDSMATATDMSAATAPGEAVLLALDEQTIYKDDEPNFFTEIQINEDIARVGQRRTLRFFEQNIGRTIDLFSGEVGNEGWHALKTIPASWISAGPTTNGARNWLAAGPGLGGGNDPELFLDKVPNVTPLRARGLSMLTGSTVLAVVYKGEISTNYAPLDGNLQGDNLGLVAFQVVSVSRLLNGNSSALPKVTVRILSVSTVRGGTLKLFSNAPAPISSAQPFDVAPPRTIPVINLVNAR